MAEEEDYSVIVGGPVEMTAPVEGSRVVTGDCGHQTRMSPASMELWLNPDMKVRAVCISCAMGDEEFRANVQKHGLRMTPTQRDELFKDLGEGPGKVLMELFHVHMITEDEYEEMTADAEASNHAGG
jgi:hypothetical protein